MVTIIKHTLPLEEAEQPHLRDGTNTLTTRICLNNKLLLLNNTDITTPLTGEPRSMMVEIPTPETRGGAETTIEQDVYSIINF